MYLPPGFEQEADRKWPLVIFLHGAGERGSDLALVTRQGMARLVQQGRDFPFIMAAPQCPPDCTWDRKLDELDCLLEEIIQKYPVQTEQIYLTGLSMGGYGTWHWAARHPRAFAALVPICGGAMPLTGFPERAAVLKEVPIWAFHGEDDQIVRCSVLELFRCWRIWMHRCGLRGIKEWAITPGTGLMQSRRCLTGCWPKRTLALA